MWPGLICSLARESDTHSTRAAHSARLREGTNTTARRRGIEAVVTGSPSPPRCATRACRPSALRSEKCYAAMASAGCSSRQTRAMQPSSMRSEWRCSESTDATSRPSRCGPSGDADGRADVFTEAHSVRRWTLFDGTRRAGSRCLGPNGCRTSSCCCARTRLPSSALSPRHTPPRFVLGEQFEITTDRHLDRPTYPPWLCSRTRVYSLHRVGPRPAGRTRPAAQHYDLLRRASGRARSE